MQRLQLLLKLEVLLPLLLLLLPELPRQGHIVFPVPDLLVLVLVCPLVLRDAGPALRGATALAGG